MPPLTVPYHQQDQDDYCGAACAQMVLSHFGLDLQADGNLQPDLMSVIRDPSVAEPQMDAGPLGLAKVLNCKNPYYAQYRYECVSSTDPSALFQHMAARIQQYNAPAVALVYGKWHWVVVYDVLSNNKGLMVHNPWPPVGNVYSDDEGFPFHDQLLHPHKCGDGRVVVNNRSTEDPAPHVDRGTAANHISYDGWMCEYWREPYPAEGSGWDGRYVIVCPEAPTKIQEDCGDSTVSVAVQQIEAGPGGGACHPDNPAPVDARGAIRIALRGMLESGLIEEPLWTDVLARQDANDPHEAAAVPVSDLAGKVDYYLVWFATATGKRSVCARVDAQTGIYLESVAVPAGAGDPGEAISPMDANGHLYSIGFRAAVSGEVHDLHTLIKEPEVVWTPSDQSYSPFYPLYRYTIARPRAESPPGADAAGPESARGLPAAETDETDETDGTMEIHMRVHGTQHVSGTGLGFKELTRGNFNSPDFTHIGRALTGSLSDPDITGDHGT